MTVVLDTNVLVAALVAKGLCVEVVLRALRLRCVASSAVLLEELERTLREKFTVTPPVELFLNLLATQVRIVEPARLAAKVCRDPDDEAVISTAVAAEADFIVTGDKDLLVLDEYEDIRIVSPRQFITYLDALGNADSP